MTIANFPFSYMYVGDRGRRFRSLAVIVQPVVEPVTLNEFKAHLRVDSDDEDDLLVGLVSAARGYAERRIDRHLIDTRLEMRLDTFPAEIEIRLPRPPFSPTAGRQTIEIEYIDPALNTHSLAEAVPNFQSTGAHFLANRAAVPAIVTPNINGFWPVTGPVRSAVTIRWWAGFGASPNDVPRGIRAAILMLAAHWYANREAASPGVMNHIPLGVNELLAMHSWGSYA